MNRSPASSTITRSGALAAIRLRLQRQEWPRLQMSLMVILTALAGFLASYVLRESGLTTLWLRYALTTGIAYLVFLVVLGIWLHWRRSNWIDLVDSGWAGETPAPSPIGHVGGGGQSGGAGASASFTSTDAGFQPAPLDVGADNLDVSPVTAIADAEEAGAVIIAIAAALAGGAAMLWVVWIAPTLMADLLLDAAIAGGLYRRLKRIDANNWWQTAIRHTIVPFVLVLVFIALVGVAAQIAVPQAQSIGEVVAALRGG
ncbi:hypothetical protein [Montanilutibacter psychrotolerans]|nr:hypothetical protein [Lysobacter psychrotolerans]